MSWLSSQIFISLTLSSEERWFSNAQSAVLEKWAYECLLFTLVFVNLGWLGQEIGMEEEIIA